MVRAAEWDEVRKLWEARWEVERVKDEIAGERAAVERALGSEEDGWAAQVRRWWRPDLDSMEADPVRAAHRNLYRNAGIRSCRIGSKISRPSRRPSKQRCPKVRWLDFALCACPFLHGC